jgi:hypothetical protein
MLSELFWCPKIGTLKLTRALKLFNLRRFRVRKYSVRVKGPRIIQSGEFQCPKTLKSKVCSKPYLLISGHKSCG